ncbi:MAG: ABC transporter ATP-binding protein [Vibrio ordalii]|uniref:ABC transporter ATP-binding protein n=1 Tax=Vibrio ordalii TaxID=28174 RepID=UPI003F31D318
MNSLRRLIEHSGAKTQHFWFGLLGKVATELTGLLVWIMLFTFLLSSESLPFTVMLLIALSLILAQWIVGQSTKLSFLGAYEITHQLRHQLLTDIRLQPLAALRGKRLGEKVKLLTSDLKQFEDIFSHLLTEFVATWVTPIVMTIVLALIQPWLAVTLVLIFGLAFSVLVLVERRFSHQADHTHHTNVQSSNLLLEYLDCLPMLRSFGQSGRLADPLCQQIEKQKDQGLGLEWLGGSGVLLATLILELGLVINLVLAAWLVDLDWLNRSQFLVAVVVTVVSIRPLARMTVYAALLRYMLKAASRLHQLSQLPQQTSQGVEPSTFDLSLKDIHLCLDDQPVLNGVNLEVAEGEHIVLVGKSGSGKSSLLDVLAVFHIPTQGCLTMGGKTLDEIGTEHWYRHIAYVTQEVQLLGGSLRDNLLLAKPEASEKVLCEAVEAAGLSELVAKLPHGLDSRIGENGNQISGGERQRLSIARALLHDAPILLLDEFTSALDSQTQAQVLQALEILCQGKTVISVAHRLETIQQADTVYLMEAGQLRKVEQYQQEVTTANPQLYKPQRCKKSEMA